MDQRTFSQTLQAQSLLPILRMADAELCLGLAQTLAANGFGLLEITLDTPEAGRLIEILAGQGISIGAGTVLTAEQARQALNHGARFLVSPGLSPEVAEIAREAKVVYLPGVLTPTEITQALNLNLNLLKLFPASLGGPAYLKELKGPFRQVQWLVTGGVDLKDVRAWKQAGALAIGHGTRLVSAAHLAAGNWQEIADELKIIRQELDNIL